MTCLAFFLPTFFLFISYTLPLPVRVLQTCIKICCVFFSLQDAHNAILDFDTNTSFWAVYDGHGGAEVSAYCALKLPDYLKKLDTYKGGDYEKALKDAFIGFDLTLLEPSVIEELKTLAKKNPDIGPEDSDQEDEDENIADLYHEARMPLREVLEKYKEQHGAAPAALARLQKSEASSKPLSPYLKGPRTEKAAGAGPSVRNASGGSSSSSSTAVSSHQNVNGGVSLAAGSSSGSSSATISVEDNDATVSSSSSGKCEDLARDSAENQVCNVPDSSSSNNTPTTMPKNNTDSVAEVSQSSTSTAAKKVAEPVVSDTDAVTNGDVVCGSSEVTGVTKQSEGVSSSSSGVFENGEVSSNTNNEVKLVDSSTDESEDEALEEGKVLAILF